MLQLSSCNLGFHLQSRTGQDEHLVMDNDNAKGEIHKLPTASVGSRCFGSWCVLLDTSLFGFGLVLITAKQGCTFLSAILSQLPSSHFMLF